MCTLSWILSMVKLNNSKREMDLFSYRLSMPITRTQQGTISMANLRNTNIIRPQWQAKRNNKAHTTRTSPNTLRIQRLTTRRRILMLIRTQGWTLILSGRTNSNFPRMVVEVKINYFCFVTCIHVSLKRENKQINAEIFIFIIFIKFLWFLGYQQYDSNQALGHQQTTAGTDNNQGYYDPNSQGRRTIQMVWWTRSA